MEDNNIGNDTNSPNLYDSNEDENKFVDLDNFSLWDQKNQTLAYFDFPIK